MKEPLMAKVGKKELVEKLSAKTGLTQKDIASVVDAFVDTIGEELKARNEVALVGFGTFSAAFSARKEGVAPGTGKPYVSPEKYVPKFKAGKGLKEAVV